MNVLPQLGLQIAGASAAAWLDANYADKAVDVGPLSVTPGAMVGVGVAVAAAVLGNRLPGRDVLVNLAGGMVVLEGAKLLSEQINPYLPQPGSPAQLPAGPAQGIPQPALPAQTMGMPQVGCAPDGSFVGRTAIGQQMQRIRASYGYAR